MAEPDGKLAMAGTTAIEGEAQLCLLDAIGRDALSPTDRHAAVAPTETCPAPFGKHGLPGRQEHRRKQGYHLVRPITAAVPAAMAMP